MVVNRFIRMVISNNYIKICTYIQVFLFSQKFQYPKSLTSSSFVFLLTSRWLPSGQGIRNFKSGVTDHASRNNHVIDWKEVTIVDIKSDDRTREIKESI